MENQNGARGPRAQGRGPGQGGGRPGGQGRGGPRRPGQGGGGRGRGPRKDSAPPGADKWVVPATPSTPFVHDPEAVRFVPLGGLEEIGRNCSYYEYGNEIVIVDVGIQFPEDNTPGIDYIIPNVSSLEPKKENIRGIILTHGHYDHIAAIHYVIGRLGNPIIYTSQFTKAMVEKRHEEFPNAPRLRFQVVKHGDKVRISDHMEAEFFSIEHTIPESLGFMLRTPVGNMVSFGDYRLDIGKDGMPHNLEVFEKLAGAGVHTLFLDSTRAEFPGHGPSEESVQDNVEALIKGAKGRIVIATFASLVDRLIQIMDIADKLGKKVAINGRGMITNMDIAKNLGYLKGRTDHLIPVEDIGRYKDHELIILTTGAQGEPNAGLWRMAKGEHRFVTFKPTDTVIFSSSVVPGNEWAVQELQDAVARLVGDMFTSSNSLRIHAGGHAYGGDQQLVMEIIKPKFVVPIHGYFFMRKTFLPLAEAAGMSREQVRLMDNGQVASLTEDAFVITKEKVNAAYVTVDGLGVGEVDQTTLRDRVQLSEEGFIAMIVTLDRQTGRLLRAPEIVMRGFLGARDTQNAANEIGRRVQNIIGRIPDSGKKLDAEFVRNTLREQINQFVWVQTKRRPMLLPIVIEL